MLKSKKVKKLSLLLVSCFALVGCDDEIKLPVNYDDPLYTKAEDTKTTVVNNKWENYYNSVASSNEIYEKTVNQILLQIASKAHNYSNGQGENVYEILNDYNETTSVADSYSSINKTDKLNLSSRAEENMKSTALGGSYSKDNLFLEKKYARYLNETYFYLNIDVDSLSDEGKFLTPYMTYSDIFSTSDTIQAEYKKYMEEELYDDMKINYLTAEYIYTKSAASIGNSNARKVQIIGLKDRTDVPGAAKKLLNAYIRDYIGISSGKSTKVSTLSDPDFSVLSRLWKGITSATANEIAEGRYSSEVVLSAEEEQWLRDNQILPADSKNDAISSETLTGQVLADKKTLEEGKDDYIKADTSLESTYTGSYTYSIEEGIEKAIDDIASQNLVTKGIYLSSSGISNIPSSLSSRIFSTKLSTSKSDVDEMKANPGTRKDISIYGEDGYRYLTVADTLSGAGDDIVYYDADSKTYYLVRLLDIVNTAALSSTATNSIYDTEEKREQISREVAYTMSTTGSYKSTSAIYWLSRTKIKYSDDDFLEYMKSTYKDIFKTENPYTPKTNEEWITLD